MSKTGTISTRSGTWKWALSEAIVPETRSAGNRVLLFRDPENRKNEMTVTEGLDLEDLSNQAIERLSRKPENRQFDADGVVWNAIPLSGKGEDGDPAPPRVLIQATGKAHSNVELPEGLSLGELTRAELSGLIRR